jgi:crossover junction endodeoxyribonuclease RusA
MVRPQAARGEVLDRHPHRQGEEQALRVRPRRRDGPEVDMTEPFTITLPWRSPPLSLNDREHWRPKAKKVKEIRAEVRWAVRATKPRPPRIEAAEVVLHWRIHDRRRRDLDNLAATLKPAIDALVDEHVLPDDDWTHVLLAGSRIHPPEPGQRAAMWLEVIPKEPIS